LDTSSSSSKLSLVRSRTSKTVRSELSSERTIGDFSNGFALNEEGGVVLVVVLNAFEKEQTRGADDDDEAPLLLQREEEKDDEEDCIVVKFCREC
jgi:hypothetical protein